MDLDLFAFSGTEKSFNLKKLDKIQLQEYQRRLTGILDRDADNSPVLSELCFVEGFIAAK